MKVVLALLLTLALAFAVSAAAPRRALDDTQCTVCKILVQYVEGYLAQNSTEQQIEDLLSQVCAFLPVSYQAECNNFVNTEIPAVIAYIEQTEDPEAVCTLIGLCGSARKPNAEKLAALLKKH